MAWRIGIVGTNFISDWLMEAILQSGCCEAAALYSRTEEKGGAFAAKHGIARLFTDFSDFVNSDAIDAVYLASPNALHYPQALEALRAGKHVLCEKPLALNAAQAEAMFALAEEKRLVLMEAIRPVHDPFLAVVRENLPRIGRLRRASFEFCQYSSRYERFKAGETVNVFNAALGNGAVMDLGVYCLHCCVALFGAPKSIAAGASFLHNGTEAAGTALLGYGDMQASINYSKVTASVCPSFVQGENGSICFDTLNQPSYVKLVHNDKSEEPLPFAPIKNNMLYELRDFCACMEGAEDAASYREQSMRVLRVMDEMRRQCGVSFGEAENL